MSCKTDKVESKLTEIADNIFENKSSQNFNKKLGLYSGEFGKLFFMYAYSHFSNQNKYLEYTYSYTDDLIHVLNKILNEIEGKGENVTCSYSDGLSGILYILELLNEYKYIEFSNKDFLNDIEKLLGYALDEYLQENNYDFLHGATGLGFYYLKTGNTKLVEKIIDSLYDSAIKDEKTNGLRWVMPFMKKGAYGISLAHGISSIIIFLTKVVKNKISITKSLELLNGAMSYLLAKEIDFNNYGSHFSEYSPTKRSRLAWCYGDLGIANAIWKAGKVTENTKWKEKAFQIFRHAAQRKDLNENFVREASICHGSSGIALIFRRISLDSNEAIFNDTVDYWIDQTIYFASFEDGLAGYKTNYIDGWIKDYSLLNGISGIGLSLLSYLKNETQEWDELLLLS